MTNPFEILKNQLNTLMDKIEKSELSTSNATVEEMLKKLNNMSPDQLRIVNELILLVEGAFKNGPGIEDQKTVLNKSQMGSVEMGFEAIGGFEETLSMDLLTKFIKFIENAQRHKKQNVEIFADAILQYSQYSNCGNYMKSEGVQFWLNGMSLVELQQFFMVGFIVQSILNHPDRPTYFGASHYGGTSSGKPHFNQKSSIVKLTDWFRMNFDELKRKFKKEVKRIESATPGFMQGGWSGKKFTPEEIYQKGITELELDQSQYNIAQMGMELIDKMMMESRNQIVSNIPATDPMPVLYHSDHQRQNVYPSQHPCLMTSQQPYSMTSQQPYSTTSQQPYSTTSQQQHSTTFQQPYSITSQQPYSITSQQQYSMPAIQKEATADAKIVTNSGQSSALPNFFTRLEKMKEQSISAAETPECVSPEPEPLPTYEPQTKVICEEELQRRAKLREEQELFEKQLATKKADNKRTEDYLKEKKLRSDEKAELEFQEAYEQQKIQHEENLKRIQEEIEDYERETQRLLQDRIREWKACNDAFFACLHLKQLFKEKEKEWSNWLSSLGDSIKELKTRWDLFEKIVKNLTKSESSYDRIFMHELTALHNAAQSAYESLFDACTTVKDLFGKFPDGVFLSILHGKLVKATNKLCNILDRIDQCLGNPESIQPIRDSFMDLKSSDVPSTGQLRKWSKEQSSVAHGIEEPRVYRAQAPVKIQDVTSEASGGNHRYETSC